MVVFMQSPIEQERRETPRIKCQSAIEYRILNPDQFANNFICDISEKGLSFQIDQWIPKDIPVNFQTKLADNLPTICGKGKIIWSKQESHANKYRIGVTITELDKESASRLSEFLQKTKEQAHEQS